MASCQVPDTPFSAWDALDRLGIDPIEGLNEPPRSCGLAFFAVDIVVVHSCSPAINQQAIHTIVDKLTDRYPLPSAHGHAQAGRAECRADQAREGLDPGAARRDLRLQPAIHQRLGAGSPKPNSRDGLRAGDGARGEPS